MRAFARMELVCHEACELAEYLRDQPQFRGLSVEYSNSRTGNVFVCLIPPRHAGWYRVTVTYAAKAELGRFVYIYQNKLRVYSREALVEIMHRDILMDRLGVKA